MLGVETGTVLHLRAPRDSPVLEALRSLAESAAVGVAAFDAQLRCLWATPAAHRRFVALTERPASEAAETLFTTSGAFPRWTRGSWAVGGRELPTTRLVLERGRESVGSTILPVVDPDDATLALLMVFDDGSDEAIPESADAMWWWQRLVDVELAVVASRTSGAIAAVSPRAAAIVGRLRGPVASLVRSPNREEVEAAHRRFIGGEATAGVAALTLATEAGGLERVRLLWMTLSAGAVPLLKLELLRPMRTVDGLTEGGACGFEDAFSMVQASPDPMLAFNGAFVVAASPACEAVLGRSPESLLGHSIAELGAAGDAELERLCDQLSRGLERAARTVIAVTGAAGTAQTVELHLAPMVAEGGRRSVAVARRVAQRDDREREAERLGTMLAVAEVAADETARLRACLELLREEVGATSVQLVRPDPGTGAVRESYRDPAAALPVDERRLADWDRLLATTSGPVVVPDEERSPGCWLIAGVTLLGGGGQWLVGAHLDRPATSKLPDRLRRAVQVLGWVVGRVERDRQVEALLRERELLLGVLDSAGVPAVVTDADSHVELASEMFCALLGTDPEEVAGLALPELVDGATASRLFGPLQVLLSEGGSWEGELHGTSRWGAPLMLRLRLEAHVGPDGRPIGLVACAVTGQPR